MSINIAIDGPAGAGKSTVARMAAARLGFIYVDTGAMYRAAALYCLEQGADIHDEEQICAQLPRINTELVYENGVQKTLLNGEDVSEKIRTPEVSAAVSAVSAVPRVRELMADMQKKTAERENVIMDGRDIGTAVLPHAQLKIFLTASPEERARRRYAELARKPDAPSYDEVLRDIVKRDYDDSHRAASPLKQAEDAVLCDTTELTLEQAAEKITRMIEDTVKGR
ncbi:MAG: (d)CMP kinase [Ruminococcus sp.]|nr:(d)CMP kinase [Ruminococcus sp.]